MQFRFTFGEEKCAKIVVNLDDFNQLGIMYDKPLNMSNAG